MAAYAALLSLMHTISQIQSHPRPPISLDQKQVQSLTQNLTLLQDFLEICCSSTEEEEGLESRIAAAAYAAEDVIESDIADQIHVRSTSHGVDITSVFLYQGLERVIQDMDLIKKEVETIKEKMGAHDYHQLHRNSSVSTGSVRPPSSGQNNPMVGFDDLLIQVMDKLIGQQCNLQIFPIVGMGGIGKTTLARNIYTDPLVVHHFDILAWVIISQVYSRREILQVLCRETWGSENDLSGMSEDELGERVYRELWGRRYLIVIDDIWSIEAWDNIKPFFPNNSNGSRIMITTRLSNLALQLNGSHVFQMKFLDEDKSWNLLCEIVFGKQGCPIEMENIGKEIARNCRGLPLSIVVIGGLLSKSKMTREYWEYTRENLNSVINLENNQHCFQILHTSYKELPIHLEPCFLYMGVFPEDYIIHVSELIRLWVAEGILKLVEDKSLEEVAEECAKELIDRNLVLVHELRWNGKAKLCKIHDLLRDLCLREAQKQRFLCVLRQKDINVPQSINIERRICIHENTPEKYSPQFLYALESSSLARSLLLLKGFHEPSSSYSSRLLRIYSWADKSYRRAEDFSSVKAIFQQANLRYFSIEADPLFRFPSSWSLLWNLQTLKVAIHVAWKPIIAPSEIWKMPLLRHVMLRGLELPDPPSQEVIVLGSLQTLSGIWNLECSEEVVKRIPNIKTLKLLLESERLEGQGSLPLWDFMCSDDDVRIPNIKKLKFQYKLPCLNYLRDLQNLKSLNINYHGIRLPNLTLPHSLKKLTLCGTWLPWEELTTKIGPLPLLQVLKLQRNACTGPKWETVKGKFCSLKFLLIDGCYLQYWKTDGPHFPRLEYLVLQYLKELEGIPLSIGDIPTLQSIQLKYCSRFAAISAKRIKKEQEDDGNLDLKVHIGMVAHWKSGKDFLAMSEPIRWDTKPLEEEWKRNFLKDVLAISEPIVITEFERFRDKFQCLERRE